MSHALVVVLARAGSKGLAHKNALSVAGKPMLGWTIEHALASMRPTRVALSTDGEALAAIPGLKAVASNSPHHRVVTSLARAEITACFGDRLFSAHSVARPKPAPGR